MSDCVYLDYNATTPVDPAVLEAMLPYLRERYGNPSSSHPLGEQARDAVLGARGEVARLVGAQPTEIVFTGCATEANNLAIQGAARALRTRGRHVVTTAIEHPSVLEPFLRLCEEGWEVTIVPVDGYGLVDPAEVVRALRTDTVLVSVMHANNEIGTIQPVAEIAAVTRARSILLHIDAAQSVGKISVNVDALGADLLTLAGHKFYAPKGVGALYVRARTPISPVLVGAGQEYGLRPGTENVPAIVALGKAARLARLHANAAEARLFELRERLHRSLLKDIPGLALNGHPDTRLPNTLNVSFPGAEGQVLLQDLQGKVCASVGAACHSGDHGTSGVLAAMGLPADRLAGAVRFSVGLSLTELDLLAAVRDIVSAWKRVATRASLRSIE
jgi:cysteine desulfurase